MISGVQCLFVWYQYQIEITERHYCPLMEHLKGNIEAHMPFGTLQQMYRLPAHFFPPVIMPLIVFIFSS